MQLTRKIIVATSLLTGVLAPAADFLLIGVARAEDPAALPTGKDLMEKFIAATGGRAAYEKLTNRTVETRFDIPKLDMSGNITVIQAAPNKIYSKQELPGFGVTERGSDGEIVWDRNPATGVRIIDGPERDAVLRELTFNSELIWESLYKSAETVGIEDVGGKPAYKVKLVSNDNMVTHQYFDKESGLLVRTETTVPTQQGNLPMTATVSEYKEFDGIKIPVAVNQEVAGIAMTLTIDKVQHNTQIPPGTFDLPDDVKKLKEREAEKARQK